MNLWQRIQYTLIMALSRRIAGETAEGGNVARLHRLAGILGGLLWRVLPSRRALAVRTMMERLDLPQAEATALARKSFTSNALSFLEITLAPEFGFHRPDLRVECPDILERLRTAQRPLITATAHLGAWELNAGLAGEFLPQPQPRIIVVRNHGNEAVRRYMFAMRGSRGGQVIGHRNAAPTILKALRRNGLVGFLVDHNASSNEAMFLPFLGKIAAVNVGPAVLAVRARALIFPTVVIREQDGYALLGDEVLDTATLNGTPEENVRAAATFYTAAIERWVRAYPDQWFWMHKRWKTRPPEETQSVQ